jgi:hypothetical protein
LLRISLDGGTELLYRSPYYLENPVPSPDGKHLAFGEMSGEADAWVIDRKR